MTRGIPAVSRLVLLVVALLPGAPVVQAQDFGARIEHCRAISERVQRFECYDQVEAGEPVAREVPAATTLRPATAAPLPSAPATGPATPAMTETPAGTEVTLAGFGTAEARLQQDEDGRVELVDRVAGLKFVQHNQWQITLESGQVWRQMLSQAFNLKAGHEVRITPIGEGLNYRLSSSQLAGSIQVRRVR